MRPFLLSAPAEHCESPPFAELGAITPSFCYLKLGSEQLPSLQPQLISSGYISPVRNRSKTCKILYAVVFALAFKNIILNYTALKPVTYPSLKHIIITSKMERKKKIKETQIKPRIFFKMPLSFTAELVYWSLYTPAIV